MKSEIKMNNNREGGFLELIVLIIVAVFLMNYFGLTISGILAYFGTSFSEIIAWFKTAFQNVFK